MDQEEREAESQDEVGRLKKQMDVQQEQKQQAAMKEEKEARVLTSE